VILQRRQLGLHQRKIGRGWHAPGPANQMNLAVDYRRHDSLLMFFSMRVGPRTAHLFVARN